MLRADLLLYHLAVRDILQLKRIALVAPLAAIPALIALFWRMAAPNGFVPAVAYNTLAGLMLVFILVLFAAIFSTGVISQEIEGRTILYLLTRPIPRARILTAKFLGAVSGMCITIWAATLLLAVCAYGPARMLDGAVLRDLLVLPLGSLAYGAFFLFIATALNKPLIYSLFFAFGWESWIPLLPGLFKNVSILTYLRVLAPHPNPVDEGQRLAAFFNTISPNNIPEWAAWLVLSLVTVGSLALALLVFSIREYAPREDAE